MESESCGHIWDLTEEVAGVGYWEWEIQSGKTFWSERKKRIYGLDSEEEPSFETFLSLIDDQTRQLVEREIEQVLSGEKAYYDLQHRIHLREGREVWIHEKGYLVRDERGNPLRMVGIVVDITARKKLERDLIHEKHKSNYFEKYDPLTRLPNRYSLYGQLDTFTRKQTPFSLFFLDIEDFGTINSTFGHLFGDRVLLRLARQLERLFDRGQIYHYGADNFALLLPGEDSEMERAIALFEQRLLSQPLLVDGQKVALRLKIGVARFPDDAVNAGDLITHASSALSLAKNQPQNSIVRFQPYMEEQISRHYHSLDTLNRAIETRAFVPYYQPIIDVRNGRVVGLETLVRWIGEDGKIFALPDSFLPLAREHHLIHHIDYQIMEQALEDLSRWRARGVKIELSCNIHLDDFTRSAFAPLFRKHQSLLSQLIVEISEEELLRCTEDERERMEILRELGIRISIDDFGTGYSSLRYLHSLPIDEIKIDRSFLRDLPGDPQNEALIRVLKNVADIYRLECIVEGVERAEQSDFLASIGLPLQQGYLFAHPMPFEKCDRYLARHR